MADGMGTGTVSAAPTHAVVNGLNGTNRSNGEKIGQGQTQQTNGVNGIHTVKHNEAPAVFSWSDPHPIFVIILVGPEETPFGIQLDLLTAKSEVYRQYFKEHREEAVERLVSLPDMSPAIFGYVQKYMFTGQLVLDGESLPSYETLVAVWKAGYDLGIEGLGNKVLETMKKCRKLTQHVPSAQLIVRVWKDTPEGSSIRDLILSWTAEYLRASELRAEFAKALPQEALSELVVMMSKLPAVAATSPAAGPTPALHVNDPSTPAAGGRSRSGYHQAAVGNGSGLRRSIQQMQKPNPAAASGAHGQLAGTGAETSSSHRNKKMRLSGPGPSPANDSGDTKPPRKKPGPKPGFRAAMKAAATARRRESGLMAAPAGEGSGGGVSLETREFTDAQKVEFCADLLLRMMSGPGFWTRLVRPFKEAVDPVRDGVPDYFEKVQKPMDLGTIKRKMDQGEYKTAEEFAADVRQISTNCYIYWKPNDPLWLAAKRLEKTFEEKYAEMNKWLARMTGVDDEATMAQGRMRA